jgi:hypothetical protein
MEAWKHHRAVGNVVVGALIGLFLVLLLANIARTGEVCQAIRTTQQSNTSLTRETHSHDPAHQELRRPGRPLLQAGPAAHRRRGRQHQPGRDPRLGVRGRADRDRRPDPDRDPGVRHRPARAQNAKGSR